MVQIRLDDLRELYDGFRAGAAYFWRETEILCAEWELLLAQAG